MITTIIIIAGIALTLLFVALAIAGISMGMKIGKKINKL